jgi:hypothetical protein
MTLLEIASIELSAAVPARWLYDCNPRRSTIVMIGEEPERISATGARVDGARKVA